MRKHLLILFTIISITSCTSHRWRIVDSKSEAIAIDAQSDSIADKTMLAYINKYKTDIDMEMNQVIAQSSALMQAGKPESLLSNWNADIYLSAASEFLHAPVDMSVVNMGSLRAPIPQGDVTVRNIFELMPFENELVVLWLKGSDIIRLFNIFVQFGGQGIGGASFEIDHQEAVNCKIQGKVIDANKLYSIATNDFLAGGNDSMTPLANPEKRVDTGMKIRNILMEHVIRTNRKGEKIGSKLDNRIKFIGK